MNNAIIDAFKTLSLGTDLARTMQYLSHAETVRVLSMVTTPDAIKGMNQKGAMRLAQACSFIASGDMRDLDKGTAVVLAMVGLTQQQTIAFGDARHAMGELVDGSSHVAGVSRQRLHRYIGRVGTVGTIRSKLSRTVSNRGFLSALGVTVKGDAHSFTLTDAARSHPFVIGYCTRLAKVTDDAFEFFASK